ncbi:MAG: CHAT domain-containing tetratricopeptide repeat protein, partial [Candidatus Methanofastidiosia archaeon]
KIGNFSKSIEYYKETLKISKKIGDKVLELDCNMNISSILRKLGKFKISVKYHEKSLEIAKDIKDKSKEAKCLMDFGYVYNNLGNFRKAIEYYEKSLEIAKDIKDTFLELECYGNLGSVYTDLGHFKKAIDFHEKTLEMSREVGDKFGESHCYRSIGISYHNLGDIEKAIKYYEKSLEIAKDIKIKSEQSHCYANIGNAYYSLENFRKSIKYLKKSLKIAQEIQNRAIESVCYTDLGNAYHGLGDLKKASKYYGKALKIVKETGNIDIERIANINLGRLYYTVNPQRAYTYCKRSLELSEIISRTLVKEEHKIGFPVRLSDAYQWTVSLCMNLEKREEAFEYSERSKSRAFLDLLAVSDIKPTIDPSDKLEELFHIEGIYLNKLREIQTAHLKETKPVIEPGKVEKIHETLHHIYDKIEKFDPEYVFMRRGTPSTVNEIQKILSLQRRDIVLIEYFIARDETFIFVISSRDGNMHTMRVPLTSEILSSFLEDNKRKMYYVYFHEINNALLNLAKYLIEPVSKYLIEGDLIYFVPYGLLHYLPLHALDLHGEPVIMNHPVAYIPSASLLKFCQKGDHTFESCASFGAEFEEEAQEVAEFFNTRAYTGRAASKDTVLKNRKKDIIHFACHGHFDYTDPLLSGIKLHNGLLTAKEIFNMRLSTQLVTLSACQTGMSKRNPGDELIGLTRAFMYAGAPSVVVSLWSVDSPSTQELMAEFYSWLKKGEDKATALQKAQKTLIQRKKYSHPFFWSPFILIGDWK